MGVNLARFLFLAFSVSIAGASRQLKHRQVFVDVDCIKKYIEEKGHVFEDQIDNELKAFNQEALTLSDDMFKKRCLEFEEKNKNLTADRWEGQKHCYVSEKKFKSIFKKVLKQLEANKIYCSMVGDIRQGLLVYLRFTFILHS
jgi:hypothetical protein